MGEINGFPCGKETRRRVLFFKTSICCFHRSPSKATAPFLLPTLLHPPTPSYTLLHRRPPVMRATPESVITSRQWKVICRFTARWTGSIPLLQFSTFHEWKAPGRRRRRRRHRRRRHRRPRGGQYFFCSLTRAQRLAVFLYRCYLSSTRSTSTCHSF